MADSQVRKEPETEKDNEYITINNEKLISNVGRFYGDRIKEKKVMGSSTTKQVGTAEQVNPSQFTNRFSYLKTPGVETAFQDIDASNLPGLSGRQYQLDRKGLPPMKYSVHFSSKQSSVLQSSNYNAEKFEGITGQRSGTKDGVTEREGEFTFAAGQGVFESDKAMLEVNGSKAEKRTETLRMKLCEILGTVSSPTKLRSASKTHNMGEGSLQPEQPSDKIEDKDIKPKQSSDTIETDSENPDLTSKRPVTRSLTRKRAPTKVQHKENKGSPYSADKKKDLEGNVFTFEEGSGRKRVLGGSSSFMEKGVNRKFKIPPRRIWFSVNDNAEKIQQETFGRDTLLRGEETSSVHKKKGAFPAQLSDDRSESHEPRNQEKEFERSPLAKRTESIKSENLGSANRRKSSIPFVQKDVGQPDDFQSPTFRFKMPNIISSLSSTPKTEPVVNDVSSPASADMGCSLGDTRRFRKFSTSESASGRSSSHREIPEIENTKDSTGRKVSTMAEEKDLQDYSADSSSEGRESGSSQEVSVGLKDMGRFARPATIEKENLTLRPIKRMRGYEGSKFHDISTGSPYSKGGEENDSIHETSELNVEDAFSRAIAMFASELEKLQRKMKSVASKRSSDILLSVSEEIQKQLLNVQSQIQIDIEKLTRQSKLKRKWLETSSEDQQNQLRLIHEKFKEEVNLHLQDFRSTLEGLEPNHVGFKGTLEKQKALLHKRLLEQVEEATGNRLDDAQRKIAAIHESTRKKMLYLKRAISVCLR